MLHLNVARRDWTIGQLIFAGYIEPVADVGVGAVPAIVKLPKKGPTPKQLEKIAKAFNEGLEEGNQDPEAPEDAEAAE